MINLSVPFEVSDVNKHISFDRAKIRFSTVFTIDHQGLFQNRKKIQTIERELITFDLQ